MIVLKYYVENKAVFETDMKIRLTKLNIILQDIKMWNNKKKNSFCQTYKPTIILN